MVTFALDPFRIQGSDTRDFMTTGRAAAAACLLVVPSFLPVQAALITPEERSFGPGTEVLRLDLTDFNPDNAEFYEGTIGVGDTKLVTNVTGQFSNLSRASMHWYRFDYDGVTPIIIDTFGEASNFGFGGGIVGSGGGDSELALFDTAGNFLLKNDSARGVNEDYVPPYLIRDDQAPDAPPITELQQTAIGRQLFNPLDTVEYNFQAPSGDKSEGNPNRSWAQFADWNNLSQIVVTPHPVANPYAANGLEDWDEYPVTTLPAGTYFLAVSGSTTWAGDPTNDAGDIADLNGGDPNGYDANDPFGFYTIHPNFGIIQVNIRHAGDFDNDSDNDVDDIDALLDVIAQYRTADPMTSGTRFTDSTPDGEFDQDDWGGVDDDFVAFDYTGNSRVDLSDLRGVLANIFDTVLGDVNFDKSLDEVDQAIIEANWGTSSVGLSYALGDLDGDDDVDNDDLALAGFPAIPEPASLATLALAVALTRQRR